MRITEHLIELAGRLGHWGYLIIFVVVLLECQALLGLFMPGESLVLVSGFLAAQGVFDLDAIIVTIAVAAVAGDSVGYEFGRQLGRAWLQRHGARFGVRESHLEKIDGFLRQHGGKSVFFSHFMHFLRALMPFMAGAARMAYPRFFVFNALGCALWAGGFALLGYFFGQSWQLFEKWLGRAGAVFGGVFVLVLVLARLWSWLVQHELELKGHWQSFAARPAVAGFRRRLAPQIRFVQQRLTPAGYLGLHLTIGAVCILLAGWWLGGIVQDLLAHDPLIAVDLRLAAWFNAHATAPLTRIAQAITFWGSAVLVVVAIVVSAVLLAWRRAWYGLLALAVTMGGGELLNLALKQLFQRPRPEFAHPTALASGYSFPSGHTMAATLFYGWLAAWVVSRVAAWRWRVLAPLLACLIVTLVALSRIYLGLHYLSDVMAAEAAGLMWLAIGLTGVETLRRYRNPQPS